MHASPFMNITMRPALTGSLHLQVRVYESFFLYGRIDNIYNSKFSTVYGYPEQGRTIIAGLRIII
jgi:outer membrane cobalamin receptor